MLTDCTVTRMSSERVAMRPIVDRMTDAGENIPFSCGRKKFLYADPPLNIYTNRILELLILTGVQNQSSQNDMKIVWWQKEK